MIYTTFMGRYKGKHSYPLSERFKKFVSYSSDNKCWLWTGGTHGRKKCRYGVIRDDHPNTGTLQAHRVSWMLYNGTIPNGMKVLHKCDNTLCVNPSHLFLGTQADNIHDCQKKKRHAYGEKAWNSKLTDEDVKSIRQDNRTQREIAKSYGVSNAIICYAKNRKTWKHV
jgi:hypothetical protein